MRFRGQEVGQTIVSRQEDRSVAAGSADDSAASGQGRQETGASEPLVRLALGGCRTGQS